MFLRASAKKGKVRWPPSATQAGKEDIFNFFFNEMRIRDGSFSHNNSSENDELSHKIKWLIFFSVLFLSLSLSFWNKANKNCIYRMNQISQQFLKENIFFSYHKIIMHSNFSSACFIIIIVIQMQTPTKISFGT